MTMTSCERLLTALNNGIPDRLPVTTHHLMPYFMEKYMSGCSEGEFFDHFGLDAITWFFDMLPDPQDGTLFKQEGITQIGSVTITAEALPNTPYEAVRYTITTPGGTLSMVLATDQYTTWITEHLIKNKQGIEILGTYLPAMVCDREALTQASAPWSFPRHCRLRQKFTPFRRFCRIENPRGLCYALIGLEYAFCYSAQPVGKECLACPRNQPSPMKPNSRRAESPAAS